MRERLVKEESGFTLPEMLVTMTMMIIVLFALYSIFDTGLRVFSVGNASVEAADNARLGLAKLERELRAAYPVNKANGSDYLFFSATDSTKTNGTTTSAPPGVMPTASQITFGNDLDGNRKVQCPNTQGGCEYITYRISESGSTRSLLRANTVTGSLSSSGGDPVVEFVRPPDPAVAGDVGGLQLAYFQRDGVTPAITESDIHMVRITLKIAVKRGTQSDVTRTLTTEVALRGRGN